MDARPKSNKQKRQENQRKRQARDERRGQTAAARDPAAARAQAAEQALRAANSLRRDPERLIRLVRQGTSVRVPVTSGLHAIAGLFQELDPNKLHRYPLRPDLDALSRLALTCQDRADFLSGRDAYRFANALLALSAHRHSWARPPEDWRPRSHNAYRQFHDLVRHLVAHYDVPTFLNSAWLEGLTTAGVVHQRWFLHVAQGRNIRTAIGLPIPLTRRQAHLYLQAPDDFDALGAFRRAQVLDLGGDERLARSILGTRIGVDFTRDDFWITVLRWLAARPMLDPVHHGPILDYLHEQRFVPSVPDPAADRPRLLPPQPNLTMKGRDPEALLRSVARWHRELGRARDKAGLSWKPARLQPFVHEEGTDESLRVYSIAELLSSRELTEEGRAMGHCVGTYAESCASGRTSIWSLKVTDRWGQESRLLTLEVSNATRQITQARRKYNQIPSPKELSVLRRWALAGGPALSKWLAD